MKKFIEKVFALENESQNDSQHSSEPKRNKFSKISVSQESLEMLAKIFGEMRIKKLINKL